MHQLPLYIDVFLSPMRDNPVAQVAVTAVLLLTVLDVLFGLVNALMSGTFSSAKMREGIKHKSASLGFVLVGIVADGTIVGGLDIGLDAPVLVTICVYICIMEILSLLETFVALNPELESSPLFKLLAVSGVVGDKKEAKNHG